MSFRLPKGLTDNEKAKCILANAKVKKSGCIESPYPPAYTKGRFLPYSRIRVPTCGKTILLHRFIYDQLVEEIPERRLVLHKCDNARCINPRHLELGTHIDNARSAIRRARFKPAVGERNFNARFTAQDIPKIIAAVTSGRSMRSVGEDYGVSSSAICAIYNGRSWKHVAR